MFCFVFTSIQQVSFRLQVSACSCGLWFQCQFSFHSLWMANCIWSPCAPPCSPSLGLGSGLPCSSGLKVFGRLFKVRSMCSLEVSPVLYNFMELLSWAPFSLWSHWHFLASLGPLPSPLAPKSKALVFSFLPCTSYNCICVQDMLQEDRETKKQQWFVHPLGTTTSLVREESPPQSFRTCTAHCHCHWTAWRLWCFAVPNSCAIPQSAATYSFFALFCFLIDVYWGDNG